MSKLFDTMSVDELKSFFMDKSNGNDERQLALDILGTHGYALFIDAFSGAMRIEKEIFK